MKYLRSFKLYENNTEELKYLFNMVLNNVQIYELPYAYYGDPTKHPDFSIYIIVGDRMESDDHEFLKDIYLNHELLNNVYNFEFFHISLTKTEAIITLKDFKNPKNYNREHYLSGIPGSFLSKYLPNNIFNKIKPYLGNFSSQSSKRLYKGINYSDGGGSNLSLFDWIYDK